MINTPDFSFSQKDRGSSEILPNLTKNPWLMPIPPVFRALITVDFQPEDFATISHVLRILGRDDIARKFEVEKV